MTMLDREGGLREEVVREIRRFRANHHPTLDTDSYRRWLLASKQRYEEWLGRLN